MFFYTIGYGGRRPQDFVRILRAKGIRAVVDVRLRPDRASMGSYARARSPEKGIERLLRGAGISYVPMVELGNIFVDYDDWQRRYRQLLEGAGDLLTERLRDILQPFCLMCAEKKPADCHRMLIADWLVSTPDWEAEHIE